MIPNIGPARISSPGILVEPDTLARSGHRGLRFATSDERDAASVRLEFEGMLVVELEGIGPSARGRLAEVIAEAMDRELLSRGWGVPGLTNVDDPEATLNDQLFRARCAGATGIALLLGPLRAACGRRGALDPSDCSMLRFLAHAGQDRPLTVLLDASDAETLGYDEPVVLGNLLRSPHAPTALAPLATPAAEPETPTATVIPTTIPTSVQTSMPTSMATPIETPTPLPAAPTSATPPTPPAPSTAPSSAIPTGASSVSSESTRANSGWRAWTLELIAARGPQPLAKLERLFAEAYVPLTNALADGLDDTGARRARDEFRDTFASGYIEAFPTFAVTTKRPRMVLDAFDIAARIARLHGARTTRLLLVDAMRCDVARAIQGRIVAKLGPRASLTDELVLWSALPSTTIRQLETIARGVEALRAPGMLEPDPQPPRGRSAEHIRRMRIGPRELHKLDFVESRLQSARGEALRDLPEIADMAGEILARHVESLSPRTLLFVFGDHGFTFDKEGIARCGGATPEEVLAGGFALLTGEVH